MSDLVFTPLFNAQAASQTVAYALGGLVIFVCVVFWQMKKNDHFEGDEGDHVDAIDTGFSRVPMSSIYSQDEVLDWDTGDRTVKWWRKIFSSDSEEDTTGDSRTVKWWFKRFHTKLRGHAAPYAVQLRMVEETDADGEEIYLARVDVFHNRNSYSYKLAARDSNQLMKSINENYVEACFEDKVPDPTEYEYHYYMAKNGFVDFEENSKKLTGDIVTRLHYNAADTPPESKVQMLKEALKDDPESDPLYIHEVEERFVKDFRHPRERVENVISFLSRHGQISIDDDGVIHSYL